MNKKIITNELINNFKFYFYEEERSGNTIEKYMRDIQIFREWLQGRSIDKSVVTRKQQERGNPSFCVNLKLGSKMII